jgi:hypothetical protein
MFGLSILAIGVTHLKLSPIHHKRMHIESRWMSSGETQWYYKQQYHVLNGPTIRMFFVLFDSDTQTALPIN